ncbi:winged helix-turn-helix domain-containing protein [Mesorhizobium sp.]|uniref:ATP-binding protein n=1 Tax=Mesorhizobium sp. TaxID=1871066 RepID=UPI000FE6E05E|nr:winged helix-turn-helix domain-containing protein [Mesorhizobium sp.]RWC27926.1 MAG: transcriptional regulator [Mesorhizobium sp.]TIX27703.1 MAG: transcriptional regulator [Mesorhizobium sp.]
MISAALSFGSFTLVPAERLLLLGDQRLRIGSRALDILIVLASRAGEVISKDELVSLVWRNTFVEENNLRVHIASLRKILGESSDAPQYISNVPGRGYCFVAAISHKTSPVTPDEQLTFGGKLPLPRLANRIIGREAMLDLLERQLPEQRLLTLVGPGGIGKTTVAIALADRLKDHYPGGIAFVDLAGISNGALLTAFIATKAGGVLTSSDPLAELARQLNHRSVLLVLDCCEHMIDEVAVVAETLIAETQQLTILATSREPLRIQAEWVLRLPPLDCPSANEVIDGPAALRFAAVQLFVERVSASVGGYVLSDREASVVGEICRRLDGIVLAIELAAGRVDAFGIAGVAESLRNNFDILTRGRRTALPRHQTLRATLDWSYSLLSSTQQFVLAQLSLFNQEFTLKAAQAVIAGEAAIDVEGSIVDLVAKSLVVADRSAHPVRYRLLDMTRAYAAEKLSASGFENEASHRHATHYCALFDDAARQWQVAQEAVSLEIYSRDIGNLRAALDWCFSPTGESAMGVAMTVAAIPFWYQLSLVDECLSRVQQALDTLERQPEADPQSLMRLHAALGFPRMRAISGRPSGAKGWTRALEIARKVDDVDFQLRALWALWVDRTNSGEPRAGLEMAAAFRVLSERSSNAADWLIGERMKARSLHLLGDQAGAEDRVQRMLAAYQAPANGSHLARFQYEQRITARITLARVLWLRGKTEEALREIDNMVETALAAGHNLTICHALSDAACPVSLMAGDLPRAERYTEMLHRRTRDHALDVWHSYAECFEGDILIRTGEAATGVTLVREALDRLDRAGFYLYHTVFHSILASGLTTLGQEPEAMALLDGALSRCENSGEAWYCAELIRQKGEILAGQSSRLSDARALFERSMAIARDQGATILEQRSADSLATLSRPASTF